MTYSAEALARVSGEAVSLCVWCIGNGFALESHSYEIIDVPTQRGKTEASAL
jgi:hypothetical protein